MKDYTPPPASEIRAKQKQEREQRKGGGGKRGSKDKKEKETDTKKAAEDKGDKVGTDICDMIKRNESNVGDSVFGDIGKNSVQISLFYIVFSIDKSFITL